MCKLVASTFLCFLSRFRLFSFFTCVHFTFLFKYPLFSIDTEEEEEEEEEDDDDDDEEEEASPLFNR